MAFSIHPSERSTCDQQVTMIERQLRNEFDYDLKLDGWQLFQRGFVAKRITFMTYFLTTMSGIYYSTPPHDDSQHQ